MAALSALLALAALLLGPARADDGLARAQQAELDRARAEIAAEVQLAAYDLVDELVWSWTQDPVFAAPTPVVLAGVGVPVGLGTGMQALLENHVSAVLIANPRAHVQLVHCPACTAVVVRSGPAGTILSRGIDDPSTLQALGAGSGQHALFLDVEAEGAFLVLRARLTRIEPDLPIVWSRSLSTSASTPALLRQPQDLKSAAEAREEYLAVLRGRGPITVPLRFGVRTYARSNNFENTSPPPFLWLQSGVEVGATEGRAWTSSLLLGYSLVPDAYQGLMGQSRVSRLLSGRVRSLTRPDLYGFVGGAVMTLWGPATIAFREERLTAQEVLDDDAGADPRTTFGALHAGLELRVGDRIGLSSFLEAVPSLRDSRNLGTYVEIGSFGFQSLGTEVSFCF
jgi:hypothetical protein